MKKIVKQSLIFFLFVFLNSCEQKEEKIKGVTLTESREKTMELLKTDNPEDVSYITEEYLKGDFKQFDLSIADGVKDENGETSRILYGHNLAYGSMGGKYVYFFKSDRNASFEGSCSRTHLWYAPISHYDHIPTRKECSNKKSPLVVKFVKKQSNL